jgi:hypothetical protein
LLLVTSVFGIVSASPVWRFGAGQRDDLQVLKTKAVEFIEQHSLRMAALSHLKSKVAAAISDIR